MSQRLYVRKIPQYSLKKSSCSHFVISFTKNYLFLTVLNFNIYSPPEVDMEVDEAMEEQQQPNGVQQMMPHPQCPICYDYFSFDDIWSTPCGHLFCETCIANSLQIYRRCPSCNQELLDVGQIHFIYLGVTFPNDV